MLLLWPVLALLVCSIEELNGSLLLQENTLICAVHVDMARVAPSDEALVQEAIDCLLDLF